MANEPFSTYFTTRPNATLPPGDTDTFLICQAGVVSVIKKSDLLAIIVPTTNIDASSVPVNQVLPLSGVVRYIREDATANGITFTPATVGQTIIRDTTYAWSAAQDDVITLQLIGSNWYRIG